MKEISPAPLTSYLPPDPRWALVQRVADSPHFRKGPKLRAFLLYVCENALLGRPENVREQLIGSTVFGRSLEYNLGEDNIVRVEARELRKRLEAYFAGEGREDPVVIEIPKGTYVPIFKLREQTASEVVQPKALGSSESVAPAEAKGRGTRWRVPVLVACLFILAGAIVWLVMENWHLRQQFPTAVRSGAPIEDYSFYGELLGTMGTTANRETLLVLSNPKVVLYLGSDSNKPPTVPLGQTIPAPKELKGSFSDALNNMDRDSPFQFLHVTRVDYTGMGEAVAAYHLGRLTQFLRRPVRLTQGRFLNWDHVQKQDLILLGGLQINDWTYQNVTKSNFNFEGRHIENLKPLPGELKQYLGGFEPGTKPGTALTDYGVIKMVTSPYGFNMLLLAGLTSTGTAGVGEFFAAPGKMKDVYNRIRAATPGKPFPSNWEVLIKVNVRDALPVDTSALALRPAPAAR